VAGLTDRRAFVRARSPAAAAARGQIYGLCRAFARETRG
jgi:hypothetical protein